LEADQNADRSRVDEADLGEVDDQLDPPGGEEIDEGPLERRGGGEVEVAFDRNDARPLVGLAMTDRKRDRACLSGLGDESSFGWERVES
jgi:hypothetical protein